MLTMATLQEVYHLELRQTQGLMESIGQLLHLGVPIPHYPTLSRRRATLAVVLPRTHEKEALHVVVDSAGVKVFGEGEWKVRQHGYTYRRTWRKVQVGVAEATGEIVAAVVTTNNYHDSEVLPDLLAQVDEEISQVSGDGAYDRRGCYDAIRERGAWAAIPHCSQDRRVRQERVLTKENDSAIAFGTEGGRNGSRVCAGDLEPVTVGRSGVEFVALGGRSVVFALGVGPASGGRVREGD
jgi:IS5 family transposase